MLNKKVVCWDGGLFSLQTDRFIQSSQKDGRLTNQQFQRFKCSAHERVQKLQRGPNSSVKPGPRITILCDSPLHRQVWSPNSRFCTVPYFSKNSEVNECGACYILMGGILATHAVSAVMFAHSVM